MDKLLNKYFGVTKIDSGETLKSEEVRKEAMIRKIISERLADQQQACAPSKYDDIIQTIMELHVENVMAEKCELATEKAKRLEAEKQAEELRKQLEQYKRKNESNNSREEGDLIKKLVDICSVSDSKTLESAKNMRSDVSGGGKNEKFYGDPDWFPGIGKPNEMLNNASAFPDEKVSCKNNLPPSLLSAPFNHCSSFQHFPGTTAGYAAEEFPGKSGPFPPRQMDPHYSQQPPPYPGSQYPHPYFQPQAPHRFLGGPNMPMDPVGFYQGNQRPQFHDNRRQFIPNLRQDPVQVRFSQNSPLKFNKQHNRQQGSTKQNQQKPSQPKQKQNKYNQNQQQSSGLNETSIKMVGSRKNKQNNSGDGAACNTNFLNQSRCNLPNESGIYSVNLSEADLKNVKAAINTKKFHDDIVNQQNKSTFKKKNNKKKPNQNQQRNADKEEDDAVDDSDVSDNTASEQQPQPTKQKNIERKPENTGGFTKKDSSDDAIKMKPKKNKAKKKNSNDSDNKKGDVGIFVGDEFPTLKDIEDGKFTLTQEVNSIVMIAKSVDGHTISETPKTIQDMILFHMKHKDGRIIVMR